MTIRLFMFVHMCVLTFVLPASADHFRIGDIEVSDPWARATPSRARSGAAYMTLSNRGERRDKLVAISTPVARKAELHTHLMEDNIMKMRRVQGVEVHPGEKSVFKPGGLHIMLMGLSKPLRQGHVFPMILTFETAGRIEVQVVVQKIGAMRPMGNGHGRHHGKDRPGS